MTLQTKEDVLREVKEKEISIIRLWFTDLLGQVKSIAITRREVENALTNGMGFDGSSVTGFHGIEESDMLAVPDPETFRMVPWRTKDGPVARMICNIMTVDGEHFDGDPRFVLRKALERAKSMGFDCFNIGPELEYFYLKDEKSVEPLDKGGYFDLTDLDILSDIRRDTILALEEMGINVEYLHHECGPSQHEIDIRYCDAMTMADNVITYRVVVKKIARRYGLYATFMPKPMFGQPGSGMHVHQSLFRGEKNSFYDKNAKDFLSDEARWFIAGQLKYAREMSVIYAQWVNSYKRLVPGFEAPVYIAWSMSNRSALIRIPKYQHGREKATRVELRCPDPACNPYLMFATVLHAGLDGIEQKMELEPPMDTNLYHLSSMERKQLGIKSIPDSLGSAVAVAENSEFLNRALGHHAFNHLIELKKAEWNDYRIQVNQYEIDKLLSIL